MTHPSRPNFWMIASLVFLAVMSSAWNCDENKPKGACCYTGGCYHDLEAVCDETSGDWYEGQSCEQLACGACCRASGGCDVIPPAGCERDGDVFHAASNCDDVDCSGPDKGACCAFSTADDALVCWDETTEDYCLVEAVLGLSWHAETACDDVECSVHLGACCIYDGSCTDTLHAHCDGDWNPGTSCVTFDCDQSGACCTAPGECSEVTEDVCESFEGEFHDGQTCAAVNDCEEDLWACCFVPGDCVNTTAASCELDGGFYYDGQSCVEVDDCNEPLGACCIDGETCLEARTFDNCEFLEGDSWYQGLTCAEADCSPSGSWETLEIPEGMSRVEAYPDTSKLNGAYFDLDPAGGYVTVAGSTGAAVHDAATGLDVYGELIGGEAGYYGAFPLHLGYHGDFLYTHGPTGLYSVLFDGEPSPYFGLASQEFAGNMTDAWRPPAPIADVGYDADIVAVNYSDAAVMILNFDISWGIWFGEQMNQSFFTYSDTQPTEHAPISAQTAFDGYAIAALTLEPDASSTNPGELWWGDYASAFTDASSVFVGELGVNPRRLRCLSGVCVVSNYGDGTLTTVHWPDTTAPPTIVATVDVGAGPVGIDLVEDGGNVAVVSTGLDDDTYSVTVLASDATQVSTTTDPAPAGCTAPGHALWLGDSLLISCSGSDTVEVVASPL